MFRGLPKRWPIAFALLVGTCSAQAPVEHMDKVVKSYVEAQMFMGSVAVAQHGKIVFSKSYGLADAEWSIPNSPTTKFQIASLTKQFTAASVLLLEERGKLKTEDLVRKYLPDAPAVWDKITIYNLLTMTSGIADDAATYEPGSPDRLVFHEKPLDFQPGEKWDYSNKGYLVLGYLLEKVSGQSYATFLEENLFKPLGMNDSGLDSNVAVIPHRASGYLPGAEGMENAERTNITGALSSGGLYSTSEDMLRWENGLFGGKLLKRATLRKMTTAIKNNYACGLYVHRVNSRLLIDYDGNNIGFNAQMAYYPEDELAVIVLANLNGYAAGRINTELAAVMHGENVAFSVPPKEISLSKDVLARYVGAYEFAEDSHLVLTLEGSHLIAHYGATFPIFAESETRFFSKGWDLQLEFSKNDKGELTSVTKHFNGQEEKGIKK